MNYEDIPQENKAEILERAVINDDPKELARVFGDLGEIEMTARALGTACRFCGVETVKALVEQGATFFIPQNEGAEQRYHCYSGMKYANYRSNFALYLLNITRQIKGACCCKGLKFLKKAAKSDGKFRNMLPDSERAEVLKYLFDNKDRISFDPSEMLYYAIFVRDSFIVSELEKLGVKLRDKRVEIVTKGGPISDSYWYEWISMMGKLEDGDYLPVMERISSELDGKLFHCTGKVYDITKKRFVNADITDFFRANFKTDKLNKLKVLRDLIDVNAAESLPIAEKLGWLDDPRRRDEMIEYAQQKGDRVECVAFLLDFKNRTADFAAEREKAEKKLMRELNADPNSVTELKKSWSFETQEDGTLKITRYKGKRTEVTVPSRIGKNAVTAIGEFAFSPQAPRLTLEQERFRETITKVTLPDGIRSIGNSAFYRCIELSKIVIPEGVAEIGNSTFAICGKLTEINFPDSVVKMGEGVFGGCYKLCSVTLPKNITEIGMRMFYNCKALRSITLPVGVNSIGACAFMLCSSLEEVVIPDGVTEIGRFAFKDCSALKTVVIPSSVKEMKNDLHTYRGTKLGSVFDNCVGTVAVVEPGSFAEEYCKKYSIVFRYCKEDRTNCDKI